MRALGARVHHAYGALHNLVVIEFDKVRCVGSVVTAVAPVAAGLKTFSAVAATYFEAPLAAAGPSRLEALLVKKVHKYATTQPCPSADEEAVAPTGDPHVGPALEV